uniref:microtubule-associated protein futsch-like isoform X4 n=1 Tax=Fragaria vesca subsp. vesca TaxID=101020 RepID=UPI0005CB1FC6|nr:PREDICTED: microtubule-associated protein futsch-like isoform X4 [Fragaria vesca subsp. vesca]
MDFFAMKRKQLQALCKEHGIRANLKNTEMAERLTLLFNEDEKSMTDVELVEKQLDATEMVTGFVESPKVKKVKFSPNNETFYFVATDKDSDSDCDYSPKKKSRGEKALGKKEVIAGEVEVVEIKDIPVRVLRSRKQKVVSGAVESIVSPRQVMSGVENVDGKGIKPVKFQKESNAIVLRKGKVIVRDDARKRTRNENSEGASQVVPSVEAAVENEVILPKPPLRRSKRKTTLFSPVAGAEKELGISEAVETVKLGREPVTRKDAAKPGRRSNRIACKKLSAETSDDMIATAVEMDGLIKENQEPSLLEGSSLVVYESLDRSTVLQIGKEVERDVARKRPRNKDFGGNSKVEPSLENEVLPPKSHSRRSNSRTASLTELSMPLEESKIDVGSEVQPVGNGNKTGCCFNKEAVEKSRKKRKGSRKKIDSTTKDHPDSFAISTVYSDFEKRTDILAHLNENQLVESVNFQGTSMFHKEHNAIQPVINHMESAALEDAFFSKSSIYSNSAVGVMEDTDQENTVEQNPLASPDKLSNVVVSSKFACVRHVRSMTYGPVCEGQTSNFLDLNGESETEELVVKSISRIGGVLDNQLANGVKGNVSEDQKSIGTTVMVQVKMESRKPAEAAAETIGEMHLDITVPSDTTLSPLDASAVKKADGDAQNSSTSGVSCTNGEYEQGVAELDVGENSDGHVEIMHSENAMDDGDGKEIFENCDQHGEQSILEGNERLKEENIVSAMIQEYVDSEKDRNDHLEVKSSNISIHKEMFSETAENQRACEVTELESQDEINFGSPKNCKQISSELEKCASAASSDSISRDDKTAKRMAYAWKLGENSSSKVIRGGESLSFSICSDDHTHKNDAADITGPGRMEIRKENTVDDEMVEEKPIRSKSDGWKDPERKNMHMLVGDNDGTDSFGMLEEVSREKVDEGLDTGIYGSEEETHTLHSKDTEEVHDLHNIGTSANCSADSTESSMLKPEMGVDFSTDSPVTASDLENKVLELEAASPILNNSVMNGVFRDDQTSGLNKSGPEMSKGNSKSEYIEDVKCDDTFEENPIASPCTLSSMMVSSNIACVHDVRSFTYQPECEGQTSNLVDLNEGSKTEDSVIVKSISRRCAVLDDQLASGVTAGVSEDQKLIDQIVMVQVDMESKKPTEAAAEAVGEIHLGTVPSDTILTRLDSSPVDQVGNEFQVDCALAGGINMNIGTKFSPTCVSEVPDETTFSWDKQTLGNRDSTKEVMRADNESVKALDRSQMIPIVTQEVVYHTGRNSEFDDSVMLDSHNIDGQVAKVKFPEISGVTEDSEEKYENESAYDGATKEVVSADNEPFEELDIDRTLPPVLEEVIECIEKSSNLDESVSPDLQNADGQVAEDEFLNENFGNANRESEEKSDAFDIVQMLQPAVEVEKGSNSDDSVLPDLPNTDGQVAENKFLNEIFVNAPEEIEEKYEPKSSNSDRSPITIAKRIMDELERGTMPVVLKSNGDAQHSSSCGVSYSNDEYEQGDLNCSEGDKNNLKEKEIVVEDLGMLESLSGENVDEGPDTGVCGCEEENHILISEETEEILDLHNIGSLVTCSADSTKPSMLKPEVGDDCPTDSPVTTNHVKCSLHEENESLELEAVSPISNSFGMKGLLRDDQTSGFKKSGLEMSKSNSKSEYIEDLKNTKERIDNSQDVIEELYHQEHKVMGQVVEPKFTQEMSNQCHIGSALMDTNVCIPSIWDDSEVKPCTDNTCAKPQKCSGGAIASVFNVFPSLGDLCGLKAFSKADSENAKEKVLTNACSVGQPAENLRVSEDLEAHTTIGNVMLIKQEADANSLLSFGNVGPNIVSPEVVESSKNNMAAQFAGFEVSNLRSNEASSSKGSTLDDQIKCNLGNDVLVYGNKDNNVADKVNTGSIEAITGIKNVSDGVKSVEITAQRLDGDGLSGERNSAYVKSFFDISRSRTESDSPLSLQNVSLSCGVFEKRHLSVQGGYDSIGLKPGRVSSLKFEDAGKDGIIDTSVSGLRHDQTEIIAMENIGSPLVNSLGMNWIFGDEVHNSDPEMSNATSSSEDVKIGNGGVASPQVGAGEEVVKLKSTQELAELDSIKGRALEADLKISIGVSTTPIRKKKTQRDIFIPKTPKNLIDRSDMKENFNARKSEQVTNITSGKPLNNRRALEDLQNK